MLTTCITCDDLSWCTCVFVLYCAAPVDAEDDEKKKEDIVPDMMDVDEATSKIKTMADAELDAAREKMCRWIYFSATPFTVTEDPYFRAFLKMLHPGFVPPTRLDIANKYLDREQTRLQAKVDAVRTVKLALNMHMQFVARSASKTWATARWRLMEQKTVEKRA